MARRTANLNTIARGEASPQQAREVLLAIFEQPSVELLQDAYLALRAWVWKALDQRRRDPELREWDDILSAVAMLMAHNGQPALSERLIGLHELISESVALGECSAPGCWALPQEAWLVLLAPPFGRLWRGTNACKIRDDGPSSLARMPNRGDHTPGRQLASHPC